jgi:hypothetical protein
VEIGCVLCKEIETTAHHTQKQAPTNFTFQFLIPNPDKPVVAKRKSRFIGELNIDD